MEIIMEFSRLISSSFDTAQDLPLELPLFWIWAVGSTDDSSSYEIQRHVERGVFNGEPINIFSSQSMYFYFKVM